MANATTIAKRAGLGILILALLALLYWTTLYPRDRAPGFYLFGSAGDESVENWTFANDVRLCTLQVYAAGWRPHAINLNCMATPEGDLYLSCSVCERKYWASQVGTDSPGRLRLDGVVYPVKVNRVTNQEQMDMSWQARLAKLNSFDDDDPLNPRPDPNAVRPDHWWTFRVESRS
ncbi:MAG: hypothetical protein F4030_00580 [Gammaproteobacteria bacterium]|nr:hypothetical protein [Gammaproteobacteria bacterium]MYH84636.1 hypothetical protein [Gammaproteobacteria bacterium]MYK03465.1 hypothetical protein [Gammaproteobacteria bacterium]